MMLLLGVACASASGNLAVVHSPPKNDGALAQEMPWTASCTEHDAIDVLHHDVELSLQLEPTPSLTGTGELRVRARRTTSVVVLDARALRVRSIAVEQKPLRFEHVEDRLCIELPSALRASAELSLRVAWEVTTHGRMPRFSPGQVWAGYRASAWMPTRQDPAQRATLALRIKAPATVKVAASGRSVSRAQGEDGSLVHAFALERPSPPFLFAFAAGDFDEAERDVEGVKLRALGPKGADLAAALATTEPMVRLLVDRTGVSFPAADYVQVFVHGDAAQEGAGISLLGESALSDLRENPAEDWIFSHELAHQWFAWLVPCADFGDFWLNEGFATFFVAIVKEQRWGRSAYERELTLWRESSAEVHEQGRDAPVSLTSPLVSPRIPPNESELQSRGVTYARGALVLHKLRTELGEDLFWAGIRRYVKERAGKGARTEDLRVALEGASGRDLNGFFSRWVYSVATDL